MTTNASLLEEYNPMQVHHHTKDKSSNLHLTLKFVFSVLINISMIDPAIRKLFNAQNLNNIPISLSINNNLQD